MKLSTLLVINAGVAAIYGIALIVAPDRLAALYGMTPDAPLIYTGQLFGATLIALAVLTAGASRVSDSDARRVIVLALFVGDGLGFVLALLGQLSEVVNTLGWSTVAVCLLFTVGYGYFQFARPAPATV